MYSRYGRAVSRISMMAACLAMISTVGVTSGQDSIPIKRAVLMTTGIGYFQHRGQIEGDQDIVLSFNVDDVNDLLKSMVLQDMDKGQVTAISYAPQDPDGGKLQSFDIDLSHEPALSNLLSQLRGEKVSIQGIEKISGVILGVESRERRSSANDKSIETVELLTLLTEQGIRQVKFDLIGSVKLENEKLNRELAGALSFLAESRGSNRRNVKLSFRGKGTRKVRIGYVRQTPVWKTSYRLMLNEASATLQGWAIVENTSQSDWKDIDLSLVSGNPISFVMNLYEPLFVKRPELRVNLFDTIVPQSHDQGLDRAANSSLNGGGGLGGGGGLFGGGAPSDADSNDDEIFDISQGVVAASQNDAVGVMFKYSIKTPVTLARGTSAMLPIIDEEIAYERLCIFNSGTHAKHPLEAIRLTNDSDVHITRGPLTIYDRNIYAGDGLAADIPPKSSRLVSYAISSDIEISEKQTTTPDQLTSIAIQENVLLVTSARLQQSEFLIRNSSKDDKTVLIEVPIESGWSIVTTEQLDETTRSHYRFKTMVKGNETAVLLVQQQNDATRRVSLEELTPYSLVGLDKVPSISPELKELLTEISKLRSALHDLAQDKVQLDAQRQQIDNEQERIRSNMESIDKDSDLYVRYVKKLTAQEDTLEKLDTSILKNQNLEQSTRRGLDDLLGPYRNSISKTGKAFNKPGDYE